MRTRPDGPVARWRRPAGAALLALAVFGTATATALAAPGETTRVSVAPDGSEANGWSNEPAISADGDSVVFMSTASNLVDGDTNGTYDVFVYDRRLGRAERISVDSAGHEVQGPLDGGARAAISADGSVVAFDSANGSLVPGDTNLQSDIFVRDRAAGTTERVSVGAGGAQGNESSIVPAISADGRVVAWEATASNLVAGDTNGTIDVFVHDRDTGVTERVSVDSGGNDASRGSYGASLSGDGRFVAFASEAALAPGDTNSMTDVYVHDRETGTTERVSVDSAGVERAGRYSAHPSLSADGRYVAFMSNAEFVDGAIGEQIYVRDRETGVTEVVSVDSSGDAGLGGSQKPSISADGRVVAFSSYAADLVPGDTNEAQDVFLHDRETGVTERVSVDSAGAQATSDSSTAFSMRSAISADGALVVFHSGDTTLAGADTNESFDIFVHERGEPADRTAPAVALTAPIAGATVAATTAVAADASDDRAVAGVQFLLDGEPLGAEDTEAPYAVEWDTTAAADGRHLLTARARDAAGNAATSPAVAVDVGNDTTAPAVTLDAVPPALSNDGTPTFAFSADEAATFECSLAPEAAGFAPCEAPVTAGPLADGHYTFSVRATDKAGNSASAVHAFTIDATAPEAPSAPALAAASNTGLSSADAETADTTPTFVGRAEPGATVALLVDGVERGRAAASDAGVYAVTVDALTLGTHAVVARAEDAAGNASARSAPASLRVVAATACHTAGNRLAGNRLANTIAGTAAADLLLGYAGADTLAGAGAADCLSGGDGDDRLRGDDGDDELIGAAGNDRIDGGAGRDVIRARIGDDEIAAVDGLADVVECGPGRDVVEADRIDTLTGCERVTRR